MAEIQRVMMYKTGIFLRIILTLSLVIKRIPPIGGIGGIGGIGENGKKCLTLKTKNLKRKD